MKVSAEDIYNALINDFNFINAKGEITFKLNDFNIIVEQNNVVGNIIEEWLAKWFDSKGFDNIHNHRQAAPDFWLNVNDPNEEWLEVKSFTNSPNFDVSAFRSYIQEIIDHPWKLYSKYLLIKYRTEKGGIVVIEDCWLKNVWEICSTSSRWPLKVQCKRNVINNIRPAVWYSNDTDFRPFDSLEDFLAALEETIYMYHDTRQFADNWAAKLCAKYKQHFGKPLHLKRWMDVKGKYISEE